MVEAQKKSVKVGKLVSTNHVNTVVRNYKKERWIQNSKRIGKDDSLSVWYSVEELQEFFELAKEHGADGIRMYFGAYSETHPEQPLYAQRQTVVLVATKEKQTVGGEANKDIYINTDKGSSILAYNAGKMCPPFCIETGGFDEIGMTILDKGEDGMIVA